jgi:hypothetical protein
MNNKDLIRKYVDTGLKLPEYQITQLSGADKKTYIRKRIIASKHNYDIEKYEFDLMDGAQKNELGVLILKKINQGWEPVEKWELDTVQPSVARFYVYNRVSKGHWLTKSVFDSLPENNKISYLKMIIDRPDGRNLHEYEFSILSDELKKDYAIRQALKSIGKNFLYSDDDKVEEYVLNYLPKEYINKYLENIVNKNKHLLTNLEFKMLSRELMDKVINSVIDSGSYLTKLELSYATDEQKMKYFKNKIESGKDWSLSQEDKDWYQKNLR